MESINKILGRKGAESKSGILIDRSKSRKKKTTYIVKIDGVLANYSAYEMCKNTPLIVLEKNGEYQSSGGWDVATEFLNPGANDMDVNFKLYKQIFGERIASMVIEYNDRETGKPVITLFPNIILSQYSKLADSLARLNHETRRDCVRQIRLRENLYSKFDNTQR